MKMLENKRSDYHFEQWHLAVFGILFFIGGIATKMALHVRITTILIGLMLAIAGLWPIILKLNNKRKQYDQDNRITVEVKANNPRLRR